MTAPLIRQASSADLPTVERIVRAAYGKYIGRIGRAPGPMCDDYAQRIAQQVVWVLITSGEIAGILVLLEEGDHLLLDNVAVDPRYQGKGIGRALIDFAEQEARRRSRAEIRLYTHQAMHENIALYPRLGYEETGRGEQAGFERVFFRKMLRRCLSTLRIDRVGAGIGGHGSDVTDQGHHFQPGGRDAAGCGHCAATTEQSANEKQKVPHPMTSQIETHPPSRITIAGGASFRARVAHQRPKTARRQRGGRHHAAMT